MEKGEILSFVKMMSQYEFVNTKIIVLFFINCFQFIIINGIFITALLSITMIISYTTFLKNKKLYKNAQN